MLQKLTKGIGGEEMRVIECDSFCGFTTLKFDEFPSNQLFIVPGKAVKIDGVVYPRLIAHDIGPRMAIAGEHDFTGKIVEIIN